MKSYKALNNVRTMEEKCICECGKNPRILKHFEQCEKCYSSGYHKVPKELNKKEEKNNDKK
jgi:hypothetical protein